MFPAIVTVTVAALCKINLVILNIFIIGRLPTILLLLLLHFNSLLKQNTIQTSNNSKTTKTEYIKNIYNMYKKKTIYILQ